jgi:hypothetical protein
LYPSAAGAGGTAWKLPAATLRAFFQVSLLPLGTRQRGGVSPFHLPGTGFEAGPKIILAFLGNRLGAGKGAAALCGRFGKNRKTDVTPKNILKDRQVFDDNWIYIHDPSVKVGRIQNFKSWSPELVPDPALNCYGLEYFCFEGDRLWTSSDEALIHQAKQELIKIGLAQAEDVIDGCVVRQPNAYPVYDEDYAANVAVVRKELENCFPTLHLVGRNGMHKYNNQDHAIMTAMLCVQNILAGRPLFDLWQVNQDAEYHESGEAGAQKGATGLRLVPMKAKSEASSPNQAVPSEQLLR